MKILILSPKPPYPPKDGGSIAIYNLARGLAKAGHEIHILAMNTLKHRVSRLQSPDVGGITLEYIDVDTDITAWGLLGNLIFSSKPYTATRFYATAFEQALIQLLKQQSFDIVQIEGPYLGFYIPVVRKHSNARVVIRAHNIEHEIWQRVANNERNLLKRWYYRNLSKRIVKFEQRMLMQSDALLPITDRDRQAFEQYGYGGPMQVAPVGLDVVKKESVLTHQRAVMFLGALDWAPNQEGLIWFVERVWPEVLEKDPYVIFHIAGRNAPNWLQKKLSSVRNLIFHGEVESSTVFLGIADIVVVPILSGSGMRVKIIEAMAHGKVVVTTSIGAEGIPVVSGEHLLIADTPQAFANLLTELLSHPQQLMTLSKNALDFVRNTFDNDRIALEVSQFYHKLLHANSKGV